MKIKNPNFSSRGPCPAWQKNGFTKFTSQADSRIPRCDPDPDLLRLLIVFKYLQKSEDCPAPQQDYNDTMEAARTLHKQIYGDEGKHQHIIDTVNFITEQLNNYT